MEGVMSCGAVRLARFDHARFTRASLFRSMYKHSGPDPADTTEIVLPAISALVSDPSTHPLILRSFERESLLCGPGLPRKCLAYGHHRVLHGI